MIRTLVIVPAIWLVVTGEPQQQAIPNTVPGVIAETAAPPSKITGERDIGMASFTPPACEPRYGEHIAAVGPVTGDPEKENYARMVVGDVCR